MHFAAVFITLLPALSIFVNAAPSPAPEALNAFRVSPHQQAHGQRDMAEYAKAAGHGTYRRKVKRTLHKGEKRGCKATASSASSAAASPTTTLVAGGAIAVTSTVSSAAPATSTSPAGSGETFTGGKATYFYQNGNAGACGIHHADSDLIGAIDMHWWSDFSQPSPYCGKQVIITNTNNGKSVTITIADVCPSCVSDNSIDLSEGAFKAIAPLSDGLVPITWQWA